MSTAPVTMEGTYDKEKKTLTMAGEGPGMDGKPTKYKSVSKMPDDDTIEMTMYDRRRQGADVHRHLQAEEVAEPPGPATPAGPGPIVPLLPASHLDQRELSSTRSFEATILDIRSGPRQSASEGLD